MGVSVFQHCQSAPPCGDPWATAITAYDDYGVGSNGMDPGVKSRILFDGIT